MDWLREIPIFSDLDDAELESLKLLVHKRKFGQGEYIFHEGEKRQSVYFVRSGTVKVYKNDKAGREQIVSFLQAGEMFPHVGFFDITPYPGTAQAIEDSELAYIEVLAFENFLYRHPKIGMKVMRVLGRKILDLQQKLHDVTSKTVSERIVNSILHLADRHGTAAQGGKVLSLRFTNEELANMVGTSRETVNRVLNDLRRQGYIEFRNEGIWISDGLK